MVGKSSPPPPFFSYPFSETKIKTHLLCKDTKETTMILQKRSYISKTPKHKSKEVIMILEKICLNENHEIIYHRIIKISLQSYCKKHL